MNWHTAGVTISRARAEAALWDAFRNYIPERGIFLRDGIKPLRCLSVGDFKKLADEMYWEYGPIAPWRMEDRVCNCRFDIFQGRLREHWASMDTEQALMFGPIDLHFDGAAGYHALGWMLDDKGFAHIFEVGQRKITYSQQWPDVIREVRQ